ncbi:MAG: helix-turn-helix transcriptional regulator [Halolamina sp.]
MRYVVVALLVISALAGGAMAQESPDVRGATTSFDVQLRDTGAADWTVESTVALETPEERDGFEAYAERFEAGEASASPGVEFFESAAAAASASSDRQMSITNVDREATVENTTGTLRLQFRWTAFLAPDGDGYELADALLTEDGTWLRSLESGQELRIRTPPGYEIQRSIEARQENESLVVTGPESFDPEEFSVTYAPDESSPNPDPEADFDVLAAVLLGLLFLVVAVLAVWRWRGGEPIRGAGEAADGGPPPADVAPVPDEDADDADEESGIDHELLSDEERVEALLEENGGRMRQADIVKETDWSDAKVSQLLSRMADEGRIEKLRLGRENVISMPDGEGDQE